MVRLLMQNWWSLSDDAMEDALIDNGAIRCFAGIDLAKDNIPDATTILAFRHAVEQHQLAEDLQDSGAILGREGLDATGGHGGGCHHHPAPTSRKNEKREREPVVLWHEGADWGG